MPSPFYRSRAPRQSGPAFDATPLQEAYKQEAQADGATRELAIQQDVIAQQQRQDEQFAREQAAAGRAAAKATAQAHEISVKVAKSQGVETVVDPMTGKDAVKTTPDGAPVWQPGFLGGIRPGDNGRHVVDYRDTTGATYRLPVDSIRRNDGPTGPVYEFDVPAKDGKPTTIRRAEEPGKPLFKIDPETGMRYAEAQDQTTGGLIQQPIGMDPQAANKAAIKNIGAEWDRQKAERTFKADELRLQQQVIETENAPVREKLAETERKLKTFDTTGAHYIQEPDGTILQKRSASDTGMPVNDNPQELLKAQSWLAEKKRLEGDLARLTAEQEPVTKKLQEMQVQRDKMALSILQDGHKTKLRQLAMEKAAAKGAELWKPATQRRIEEMIQSPGFSVMQAEAETEGTPMGEELARATRNPVLDSIANSLGDGMQAAPDANAIGADLNGSALGDTSQRMQLDAVLATAPKTAKLPDGRPDVMAAAKSIGIDKPEEFDLENDAEGKPRLIHRPSGENLGRIDTKYNRIILDPEAAHFSEQGRKMVQTAGNDTAPLYVLGGAVPFTPKERAEYFTNAIAAAQVNDEEGLASVGADLVGIRRNVKEGRMSVQDAKWLAKTIHGVDQPDMSQAAVDSALTRYIDGSKVESAIWKNPKATPEDRAAVVNRFMDGFSQRAQGDLFYAPTLLSENRSRLLETHAAKGAAAKAGDWLADTATMLAGSISGLVTNIVLDAGEIAMAADPLAGYKTSERFNLTTENTAEWFTQASKFANRVTSSAAVQSALTEARNWADSADPGDQPPADIMEKLARVSFDTFHQLSDDTEAKARATTPDTFSLTKDPVLAKHFASYLETRNPDHWAAIKQLVGMDQRSRSLADRTREYVTKPRASTPQEVMDRASAVFPDIRPEQAKALLDASGSKNGSEIAAKVLGISKDDAALALDLFTGQSKTEETSLKGYFRSALQAPLQEVALEAASTAISGGFGKLAARGFVQAAKGVTVQTTRRAAAASWIATQAANFVDDFSRLGMFRARLGQPLTRLQRVSNAAMGATKAVAGDMAGEAAEEGAMEVGQAGSTLGSVFSAAGQGAIAAPVMVGGMTMLALPLEIRNERRLARNWEAQKSDYLAKVNERLAEIPGTQPLAPEEFETALALYGNAAARLDAETITRAAAVLESGPPSPQAQEGLMQAVVQAKAREALAVNATLEMRDLTEEQRTLYTAVAKAALGVPEFTLAESQALNRLGGDLAVRFTAAPGATQVDAYSATDLPGGRQAMAQGAVPIVPPALMAQVAQAAPSLGELMGMAPTPQVSPVSNGANSPTPTPAATGSKTTSGASGNAPATPAKGGVGKAQGAPEASRADGAPAPTFKTAPKAEVNVMPNGRVTVTFQGDPRRVAGEAKAKGFKVVGQQTTTGKGAQKRITLTLQPKEATKPSGQQGPTVEKPETVDSIARRVISTITSRSPKLKKLVSESKAAPDYATGGMWLNSDGTVSYHLPTLRKQLTGLDPQQIGRRIEALIDEEIRHAAHWKAAERLHKQAMATPGNLQVDFETWRDAWYGNIWENEFTDDMRTRVREAYGDTMDAMPDWMKAMEGLRMLDQLRATGSITEAVLKHLEAVLTVLKEMLDQATPAVRREIEAIQAVLVEFGYENGQVKPDAAKKPAKPQSKPKAESSAGQAVSQPGQAVPQTVPQQDPLPESEIAKLRNALRQLRRWKQDDAYGAGYEQAINNYERGTWTLQDTPRPADTLEEVERETTKARQFWIVQNMQFIEAENNKLANALAQDPKVSAVVGNPGNDAQKLRIYLADEIKNVLVKGIRQKLAEDPRFGMFYDFISQDRLKVASNGTVYDDGSRAYLDMMAAKVKERIGSSAAGEGMSQAKTDAELTPAEYKAKRKQQSGPLTWSPAVAEFEHKGIITNAIKQGLPFSQEAAKEYGIKTLSQSPAKASQPEAKPAEPSREEWQKTFAKFKRALAKAVKAKDYPEIIRQADAFQKHYEAEGSGPFPDSWSDWERHKAEAEMQLARQGKTENPLTVPILKPLTTPRPAERTDDAYAKAQEATRAALGGLFSAPAYRTIPQLEVSSERFDAVRTAAVAILAANIRTPEAFARFMDDTFPGGKARPYSEAIWDLIGVADKSLRGTHDWTTIYGKIDTPLPEVVEDEPSTEEKPQLTAKQQDEAKELEITKQAREIVMRGDTPQQTFRALVELYKNQPKLTAKTSTSKINQAYSTPAPMAFMASRLADVIGGRVIAEPSAGNGMLLIERHSGQTVLANEIDPERRQRLTEQGIMSTGQDATVWTPEQTPDRVIANPPFGQVMEQGGSNKVFQTPMGETTSIDHAILLQSLATMAPDGRAVFIIGGPPPTVRTEEGRMAYYRSGKAGKFFGHLYGNHRVIDHFTINGDLYEKQGAGWPLDVIVVQGPGRSSNTLPGMKAPRMLESWEDIARELDRTDAERIQLNQLTESELRKRTGAVAGELAGLSGGLRGTAGGRPGNVGAQPSGVRGAESDAGTSTGDRTGVSGDAGQRTIEPSAAGVRGGQATGVGSGDVRSTPQEQPAADNAGVGQLRAGEVSSSEYQAAFPATSGVNPAGLLAPVNLIGPMREAMDRLKDAVGGDLVSYVRKKLGYPEGTDISKFYFGDQIDALAQAIHTAETGGALVIGDQTGTGKGRIAAGLMKYAVHNGLVPVFVTKDQTLYDAMLDDLKDVDAGEIVPALTNTDIKEKTLKAKLADLGAERGKEVFQEIADTGELPQGTNTIFTSYDQIKADDAPGITPRDRARAKQDMEAPPGGWRMAALRAVAPRALFILDESHLAGGQSTTGWRFGELLRRAKHAYYSSATFAKRPDNMGIYFRTNLGKVGGDINGIIGLMQAGGVPAMQIGSSMLAQDGQYMRRERSFEGVTFRTHINSNTYDRDRALADNYTEGLRAIIEVQERMVKAAGIVNRILASFGKRANIPVSNRPRLESANFSAKLHNLVRQYLLAIKAQSAAQLAAQAIRDGVQASDGTVKRHKVIVTVENTMESVIDELEASGLPLNFNGVLQMYLNQMRRIKVGGGGYGREAKYFEVSETPDPKFEDLDDDALSERLVVTAPNPETGEPSYVVNEDVSAELVRRSMIGAFNEARDLINNINLADMPLSPIDAMRQAVEASGIRTGEMTGRSTGIDKNGQIYRRSAAEIRGKLQAKDAFNNEDLDFLVINKTGSTGVSMHASEKFADKRPRLMMVVQANLDINEFMQTIGRIHRAGQVELPSYINLQTALPAENRPAAILGRKMAMLNANTTSNADSELSQQDAVDIFNKYGDEVVHDYLRKNPGLVRLVAQSWEKLVDQEMNLRPLGDFQDEAEGGGDSYLSRSVTGHLAILPVDEQEAFWESVTSEYRAKIAYLDEIGKNDLRASVLDLKAETVESKVFTPGSDTGSAFERPSYIELVNAEMGRQPLSADDAVQAANDARQKAAGRQDAFIESANAFIDAEDARKATVQRNWQDKRDDWRSNQQEQRDTIANAIGLIGNFGNMEREDGSQGYAFVEDVQINAEKPNTPSAHFAIIRVNDSRDRLKVPLSQFGDFKPVAASEFNRDRMGRDGWQRSWSFGTQQAVITGNLLSALGELQARQARARVISYTKRDGSQQMGILLGQKAAEEIRSQEQTQTAVETSEDMAALVNAGFAVKNTSGNVRFAAMDGSYFLYVPLARSTGGKFWRDPGLLAITGEFEKSGSDTFVATMSRDEATRAFDYLKNVQSERFVKPVVGGGPASSPAPDAGKQAAMKEALKAMPPIWRTVLEASMKGTPAEQIAADNGLSIVAVGNVLRVAQGRLRVLLDAQAGKLKPSVRVEDEKIKASSGRPDLAMSANPAFVAVDQRRASPEEVTHGEMNELAVRLFDVDADAAERLVVRWMDSGTTVLSTDGFPDGIRQIVQEAQSRSAAEMLMTAAAKMLVTQKATAGGDPIQVARLIDLYRNTGTEQARALNMRQDPHQTPEERAAMFIAEALLTPPESMRNEIRRNPANKERILSRWAIESQKVKDALKAEGFDIDATFAALRREQAAAARTVPQEVRFPLARARGRVQRLVKSVLEGKTWREAAEAAKMTLEEARKAYNEFRSTVNQTGQQAAQAARDALLRSAPANDFAAQIGLPEWTEDASPDVAPVKTEATEALKKERTRKKTAGEIDLKNPVATARAVQRMGPFKSSAFDKISEFWRASILSGPQTHVVNLASGVSFGLYDLTLKKAGTAVLADIGRMFGMRSDAASLADVPAVAAAAIPAVKQALKDALRAWKANDSFFAHYALDTEKKGGLWAPAIKGRKGDVIRTPFRLMLMADEFVKSAYTRIEVAAQAQQIARSEGKKGQELTNRIQELLKPGSLAWARALDKALEITFQTELKANNRAIDAIDGIADMIQSAKKGKAGGLVKGVSHFLFPFVLTPTNIFKAGVTMSPLGLGLSIADAVRAYNMKKSGNVEEANRLYNAGRFLDDMVNQIVAWGVGMIAWELVMPGEDDDALPFLTGTLPWKSTSKGEREIAYRTAPPMSIRIGDTWYSYARLDPFASALSFTVDAVKAMKKDVPLDEAWMEIGSNMLTAMQDKTFLQGFSDFLNAIDDPKRFGTRWATNIATGFIPNLIRQPIRAADENIRENDLPNDMGFVEGLATRVLHSAVPQTAVPAIDVWGRPETKGTGSGSPQTDFLLRLFSPVQPRGISGVDPLDVALLRYNYKADKPFGVTAPTRELVREVGGKQQKASLSDADWEAFMAKSGRAARLAIGSRFNGRDLTENDVETIKDIISRAQSSFRDIEKRKAFARPPVTGAQP